MVSHNHLSTNLSRYERETVLNQYLLFHYGSDKDQMPFPFGPINSIQFPIRCVKECLNTDILPKNAKALELGCAVGRSSFELSRFCEKVIGIDGSNAFISAAKKIQRREKVEYPIVIEGVQKEMRIAAIPEGTYPERIVFKCDDILALSEERASFHVVLAANVLCRLRDPRALLNQLPSLLVPEGQLILISPYSWLKEFTPQANWLGGAENALKSTLELIKDELKEYFSLEKTFDMPFLIREHLRKYEWGVAQASIWVRNSKKY
jgi:putative 4-mercaptohistidine N1-methyltranferase